MKNKFMKLNEFTEKFIYKTKLIYILIFLISLAIPSIFILYLGNFWKTSDWIIYTIEIVLIIINLDLIIFNLIKREFKIEHLFLNLMIPIGSMFLISIVPNYVYDEAAHAYRTYVITQGDIITDRKKDKTPKMEIPKDLLESLEINTYKELSLALKNKTDYNDTVIVNDDGTGAHSYVFISYIFPALGMFIGSLFNLNIIITYYLARIFTFGAFLLFSYWTLKKLPFAKIVMFVYLFNPILIQQCGAVSADSIINSVAFLLIAIILNKHFSKESITKKEYWLLGILTCCLSVMKYAYLPLSLLLLLLLKKNSKIKIGMIIITSVVLSITTYFIISGLYVNQISYVVANEINPNEQIKFIIQNPFKYLWVFIHTTIANFEFYFFTFFGRQLGNYTIQLPSMISIFYAFLLFISPFLEKNKFELKRKSKIWINIVVLLTYGLVETGLYLVWTKTGANIIEGVQGRYFIPFVVLLPMLLITKRNEITFKYRKAFICICLLLINFSAIHTIIKYFNY